MQGWKTKLAGVSSILSGAGLVIGGLVSDAGPDFGQVKSGMGMVIAGLGMLGIGHKLDKLTEALQWKYGAAGASRKPVTGQ